MKKIIIVFILTVLTTILASPLYTTNYMWLATKTNDQARIDIKNNGKSDNNLIFKTLPDNFQKDTPKWFKSHTGQGTVLSFPIPSKPQEQTINCVVKGDGELTIDLKGPHEKNNDVYYPRWVEYTKLNVNGKNVLAETQTVWHDKSFVYEMNVADGQKISIEITTQRHKFHLNDIFKLYGFNWKICFSIFVLSFLLFYKVIQHILRVMSGGGSRIDIIFLCAFFSVLFIPMLHMSNAEKSDVENRKLAKYIPLISNKGINNQYGKNFESWFNDRFFGRNLLFQLNNLFKPFNTHIKKGVWILNTETQWIFRSNILNTNHSFINRNAVLKPLNNFNNYLSSKDIKLYMFIAPQKEDIYDKEIALLSKDFIRSPRYSKSIEAIRKKVKFPIVYPLNELKEGAKKDYVFFKPSHHWTEWGAYIGYQALMKSIQRDFPNISIVTEKDYDTFYDVKIREDWDRKFGNGFSFYSMNLKRYPTDKLLNVQYKYYNPKRSIKPKVVDMIGYKTKSYKNPKGQHRVLLIGDSQNENLQQFIPYSFAELKYMRVNNVKGVPYNDLWKILKRYEKDILTFKPDILILSVSLGWLPGMTELMEKK